MRALLLAAVAAAAGCVESTSVTCADGTTCPGGFQCDLEHQRCLLPEQVAACDGLAEGVDCTFAGAPGACRDGACEAFFCGDGYVTGTEACDSAALGIDPETGEAADCITAGFYAPAGLACSNACTYDVTQCTGGRCGDDEVNGPELCDGSTNRTCVAIGFDAGAVSCNAQCGFQIRDCSRFGWNPESLSDVIALAVGGSSIDDQWAVGQGGRAMHYEGAFWNSVPTGVPNDLVAVWSIAPDDTWAVGLGHANPPRPSVVIHWDGSVWSPVTTVPAADYVDVWAADASTIFLATKAGGILRGDGTAWAPAGAFPGEATVIRGSSATDVYAASADGALHHFDGSTWTTVALADTRVHFIDVNAPDDVWVAGSAADPSTGVVAHFDGATWTRWAVIEQTYNGIASSAPNDAWVAGVDGIMRHWDGIAWSRSTNVSSSPGGLAAIAGFISFGPTEVLGVSTLNLAYRYRGQAFGVYPPLGPNPFDAVQNIAMWGSAADDQYVINVRGEVVHYDGTAWTTVFTVPERLDAPVPATAIWGDGPANVWVGANDGNVYHFDGATWRTESVSGFAIQELWGSGGSDVWAFGSGLAFHRGAGGVWTSTAVGGESPLAVSGTGPDDIYLVEAATPPLLVHWDGSAWTEVAIGAQSALLSVIAIAPDDVHVTAADGYMFHWDGTAWRTQQVAALADLRFLAASGADDVIAASERDLFHWNGGEWASIRPPVDFVPNTADYIPIAGLQVAPGRVDILLARYRIRTLLRTRPLTCRPREVGACSDGVDNDCDGTLDVRDPECS